MLAVRRSAASSTCKSKSIIQTARRRFASTKHGKHSHHAAGPKEESIGKGFFIGLALIPVAIGIYKYSRPGADGKYDNPLTHLIDAYSSYREAWAGRNALHTAAVERAAFDRNLFQSSPGSRTRELRFPELLNSGAPWNVPAGQGRANLDQLIAHYEKQNTDEEARKLENLAKKDGKK